MHTIRRGYPLVGVLAVMMLCSPAHAVVLSDALVFSSNPEGQDYNGLIWNTAGNPPDLADRWNLYFSSSTDIDSPAFLNDGNADATVSLALPLDPGLHRFGMYAEAAGAHTDHFTIGLFFAGNRSAPQISAAAPVNGSPFDFVVATHSDALGLLASDGTVANAGALSFVVDGLRVTLVEYFFSTDVGAHPDLVWSHNQRHDYGPSPAGRDFYGQIALQVSAVPVPGTALLLLGGLVPLAMRKVGRRHSAP